MVKKTLESEALKKSFYSIAEALVSPILILISLPIFLNVLGVEQYGIYVLISSISGIIGILNIGGAATLTKYISKYRGDNNKHKIGPFTSTIFGFQGLLSLCFIIIAIVSIPSIISSFFFENTKASLIQSILWYAIPSFIINLLEVNYNGIHRGYEKFGTVSLMSLIFKLFKFGIQLVVLLYTRDIVDLYRFTLLISIVIFILHSFIIKILYKEVAFFVGMNKTSLKEFLSFSFWTWSISIVTILGTQLDKWIVADIFGLKILAFYGIAISVFYQIHSVISSSISWIFPKISFSGISEEIKKKYTKGSFLILIGSTIISIFLLVSSNLIFGTWLGEQYDNAKGFIHTFLSLLPILSITIIPYYVIYGLGKSRIAFILYVIELTIKFLFFITFARIYKNLNIAILAFGISFFLISIGYNFIVCNLFKINNNIKNYIINILALFMTTILIVAYAL